MNRTDRYRLEALMELAHRYPEGRSAAAIASRRGIPRAYLSRLLAELGRAGWVHSRRGPGGGVVLAEPPDAISVARVLSFGDPDSELPPALLRLVSTIGDAIERTTAPISIADLARWERDAAAADYSI